MKRRPSASRLRALPPPPSHPRVPLCLAWALAMQALSDFELDLLGSLNWEAASILRCHELLM